jgi:hypothetical protein
MVKVLKPARVKTPTCYACGGPLGHDIWIGPSGHEYCEACHELAAARPPKRAKE